MMKTKLRKHLPANVRWRQWLPLLTLFFTTFFLLKLQRWRRGKKRIYQRESSKQPNGRKNGNET